MLQSNILMYPKHRSVLSKIAKHIYEVVGEFNVQYSYCGEPVDVASHYSLPYKPLNIGGKWGEKQFDTAWMIFKGIKPDEKDVVGIFDIAGEGMVYDCDGNCLTAITTTSNKINMFQVFNGKTIVNLDDLNNPLELHIDASYNGNWQAGSKKPILKRADIAIKNKLYHELYYTYMTIFSSMVALSGEEGSKALEKILNDSAKFIAEPQKALNILNKALCGKASEEINYYAVGHGHLDLAWLWPIRESYRKARRTIAAQLHNIRDYSEYIYGISQPQQLEWVKQDDPILYARTIQAMKAGRIEPQGGMWTECDCNLVSGESLIRQFYYGKKFWQDELGMDVRTCWLPDVFGFTGVLPQIVRGCGNDSFMTIKMTWNRTNPFPYKSFVWTGIDGTELLSHMPPEGDYTCTASPIVVKRGEMKYTEKAIVKEALIAYGVGDGGCGPSEGHIEMVSRQKSITGIPTVKFSSATEFFKVLRKSQAKLPRYEGELYLEKHQGTFTSQGRNKRYNRKLEIKLHNIEYLLAVMLDKDMSIAEYELDKYWKEILLYQFHDILPGSSINRVYDESRARYAQIDLELNGIILKIKENLKGIDGVFNIAPIAYQDFISKGNTVYRRDFLPYSMPKVEEVSVDKLIADIHTMDNGIVKLKFNSKGEITSCYDKLNKKELVEKPFNQLVVYSDPVINYNAWDIAIKYEKLPKSKFKLLSAKTEITATEIIRECTYVHKKSILTQKIILSVGSAVVDFVTEVDWQEKNRMLRADFYPTCFGDKVVCDTQFGYKEYNTTDNDSFDKAKYEINAHKFIDIGLGGYGMALLNDCKYGHRVKNGKISLNLLRSTGYPDPKADRGHHEFKYAIYPHKGGMLESDVQQLAYKYNYDNLNFSFNAPTFIVVDNDNIVAETIKPTYDGNGIAIRLYERSGSNQTAIVKIKAGYTLLAADMLENVVSREVEHLSFHKFEIKTLVLRKV